jgi:hypothetical protein
MTYAIGRFQVTWEKPISSKYAHFCGKTWIDRADSIGLP